jgi:hypothetical protein
MGVELTICGSADDLIILSLSTAGLQLLLNSCHEVSLELGLKLNCSKSIGIVFGTNFKFVLPIMVLCNKSVHWSPSLEYLGITFYAGLNFKHYIFPNQK